jgi:hypothetical protein
MSIFNYGPSRILTYIAALGSRGSKSLFDLSKLEYGGGAYDMRAIKAAHRRNHRAGVHRRRK